MNDIKASKTIQFGELARAAEGLTQWRPLVMGFASLLVASLLSALTGYLMAALGGAMGLILGAILFVMILVLLFGGFSAVGVMLMDKARNLPVRSFADAAMFGVLCIPKFLLFALALFALGVAFVALAALLYFVCKIPVFGGGGIFCSPHFSAYCRFFIYSHMGGCGAFVCTRSLVWLKF